MNSEDRLAQDMADGESILLVAAPGCGKSARLAVAAAKNGRRLIVMRASLCERVDFGGCLVPDMEAGLTRALPLDVLHDLMTTTVPTLLLLDDLGMAPLDVQGALCRLWDPGFLSPSVLIWGATNRPGDRAAVIALCEPLRSRFSAAYLIAMPGCDEESTEGGTYLCSWQEELAGWCAWANEQGESAAVVTAFHRFTEGIHLYDWKPNADPALRMPDYRTWATVIRKVRNGRTDLKSLASAVGKPAAAEFVGFMRLTNDIPQPDDVWADPLHASVPEDRGALYLIATTLAARVTAKTVGAFIKYVSRLDRVYCALAARDAMRRLGDAVVGANKEWVTWFVANQEMFVN